MAPSVPQPAPRAPFPTRLWRLVRLYWGAPGGRKGAVLLALAVLLELSVVYLNVRLAGAQRVIFDAVQERQMEAFFAGVGGFFVFALGFVLASAYRIYARQCLEIDWRKAVTTEYLHRWIGPAAYAQRELHPDAADNPDQRIAEDIRNFVSSSLGLALSLLSALATLYSFSGLLWNLSADWPLNLGGRELRVPGLMLWVALSYAVLAMLFTHLVGRPLVPLNFDRQRVEADFRYRLVRFRENVEAVALARGADFEQQGALDRFQSVIANWWRLIAAQRNLTLLTTMISQANGVLPLLIAAPAYFAGVLSLGSVVQTRTAYAQVSGALTWFMFAYQEIAQWRASVERLSSFADAVDRTEADLAGRERVRIEQSPDGDLHLRDLRLSLPDGRLLLACEFATIRPGTSLCIVGPAGSGKSILFRALAGIWPFGGGSVEMPRGATAIFLPQRPYVPLGTLHEAACYPSPAGTFTADRLRRALEAVGLERLAPRLDDVADWEQLLSDDEEQRLSLARVLLHEPDWVFLDDSTAVLSEETEQSVYRGLARLLPGTTVVTMTRRPGLARLHQVAWSLEPGTDGTGTLKTA